MLHSIRVNGLLSFEEPATTITFEPLTVLIGKGGGGKTNVLRLIGALKSNPERGCTESCVAAAGLTGPAPSVARAVRRRWQTAAGRGSPPQSELRYGRILCELAGNEGGVTCIERPEAGLHPAGVWILTAKLRLAAENGSQTILTTQSPNLLNALEYDVDGVFAAKRRDGKTELRKLCTPEAEAARGRRPLGAAWCNLDIHQG